MDVTLVTPFGALFAVTGLLLLAVYALRQRRIRKISRALQLAPPALRSQIPFVVALALLPVLLGVAAAQPVIETSRTVRERTDAQAFVVVDVSRSMLASASADAATRLERARRIAIQLREQLPEVPFGVVTMTDRLLPHLFPTSDARVFEATLRRAIDIEEPPPGAVYLTFATNVNSLRALPEKNYFLPSATKRVVVVLTDGETQTPTNDLTRAFDRRPPVEALFVHVWDGTEQIYETGVPEGGYRPDSGSNASLARTASLVGGQLFEEADVSSAAGALQTALGSGPTVERTRDSRRLALMPYVTAAVLLPLGFVLLRRNLWLGWRPIRRRAVATETEPVRRYLWIRSTTS